MAMDDVIQILKPAPDSHFRLKDCRCGTDNVAYVQFDAKGGAKWRVQCFSCGHTVDRQCTARHRAQVAWNEEVQV